MSSIDPKTDMFVQHFDAVRQVSQQSVHPIYGADDRGRPDQYGSGVLIDYKQKQWMVTAAHVVDRILEAGSAIYLEAGDFFELDGPLLEDQTSSTDREDDNLDLVVFKLSDVFSSTVANLRFLQEHEFSQTKADASNNLLTCVGFPNSQNKLKRFSTGKAQGKVQRKKHYYSSFETSFECPGCNDKNIFLTKPSKFLSNQSGQKARAMKFRGMSGGAIFSTGGPHDNTVNQPKLAGITIEHLEKHDVVVGTRIDIVTTMIDLYLANLLNP